jgi:hypothetical protein
VIRLALVFTCVALVGCAKKQDAPPPPGPAAPAMPAEEVQRSRDACQTYVEKVCACADKTPALQKQCDLARALPDAVRLGLEVAASPDSKRNDVIGAQDSVRKAAKECIEEIAKLPALGCQ